MTSFSRLTGMHCTSFTATRRRFAPTVLCSRSEQRDLAWHFAKPAPDKFERFADAFEVGSNGCAKLIQSVATFECSTYSRHQEGDHTIILGRVDRFSRTDTPPLLFHSGQMGSLWELADTLARPH